MEPVKTRTSRGHLALYAIMLALFILDAYLQTAWGKEREICQDRLAIGSLLGSHHYQDGHYNENQWPSLYVNCNGWVLGFYENSYSSKELQLLSTIVAHEFMLYDRGGPVELSLAVGAVDGYPKRWKYDDLDDQIEISEKKWLPWASVNAKVSMFKIWVIPKTVVGFGLEYEFN